MEEIMSFHTQIHTVMLWYHIEADKIKLQFWRQHFQKYFHEWELLHFDSNLTDFFKGLINKMPALVR